ncbi:L-2-hydroxyglutarate dehydrogenase, mitochondrial-like [Diabrotica virgifera virgifera]|uniref:L-2-hydroxyglutarate dehydrogenase, mitochondrial n=1 Tax=Diabrotica virgifera virgifera TaxID=50390 RepID=A0A6P7FZG7_DIAVI|nr:L-2-hydroxyglutarate dehydrogenase, mitochondrial-like [Diabrotica virgifera virgifera]
MLNFWKETAKQIFKSNIRRFSLHIQQNASCTTSKDDIPQYEATVVGGGIIGTAIARQLKKEKPNLTTALIEKEGIFGKHQSRNNSGVIHCGIYYRPGSLKSVLCQKGIKSIYEYCDEKEIPYTKTGKLIIANDKLECKTLNALYERGLQNKVEGLKRLDTLEQILEKEPMCKGFKSIWCSNTGNVDFEMVTNSLAQEFRINKGDILLNHQVNHIKLSGDADYPVLLKCNENSFLKTKYLIVCAGLQSGRLHELISEETSSNSRIFVSFRVNYHLLKGNPLKVNIYETPDLDLPFLGVHLSPRLDCSTLLGPTAVPAYTIEGYNEEDINLSYLKNTLTSPNFLNMTRRYLSKCISQVQRHLCPDTYIKKLQKLADFNKEDVTSGPVAVQTQLINPDGTFQDDFVFEFFEGKDLQKRIINCLFLPSPAATSCLAIAEYVTDKFFKEYDPKT